MKITEYLKKFLFIGTSVYTAISLALTIIFFIATDGEATAESVTILDPSRQLLIMLFSFCFSLACTICCSPSIPFYLKAIIHPVLTIGAFFSCVVLPAKMDGNGNLIITTIFCLLYAAAFVSAVLIIRAKKRRAINNKATTSHSSKEQKPQKENIKTKRTKQAEYKSLFSNKE